MALHASPTRFSRVDLLARRTPLPVWRDALLVNTGAARVVVYSCSAAPDSPLRDHRPGKRCTPGARAPALPMERGYKNISFDLPGPCGQ